MTNQKEHRIAIPKAVQREVKARFGGRCRYCGEQVEKLCIDHIHPVARKHWLEDEGKDVNDPENLMPACFSCNNFKMSFDLEQFRRELAAQVIRGRKHSINFRLAERFGLIEVKEKPIKFYFEKMKAMGDL